MLFWPQFPIFFCAVCLASSWAATTWTFQRATAIVVGLSGSLCREYLSSVFPYVIWLATIVG